MKIATATNGYPPGHCFDSHPNPTDHLHLQHFKCLDYHCLDLDLSSSSSPGQVIVEHLLICVFVRLQPHFYLHCS